MIVFVIVERIINQNKPYWRRTKGINRMAGEEGIVPPVIAQKFGQYHPYLSEDAETRDFSVVSMFDIIRTHILTDGSPMDANGILLCAVHH